jgi:hypothetical protein
VPLAQQQRLESLAHGNTVRHAWAQLERDLAGGSCRIPHSKTVAGLSGRQEAVLFTLFRR